MTPTDPGHITVPIRAVAPLQKRKIGSAAIVQDHAGRIVLGVRNKDPNRGRWVIPGGKPEYGEDLQQAAIRELREETGLAIRIMGFAGVWEADDGFLVAVHHAEPTPWNGAPPEPKHQPYQDLLDPHWVQASDLGLLTLSPVVEAILHDTGWLS